jgi:hypothetical protein
MKQPDPAGFESFTEDRSQPILKYNKMIISSQAGY